MTTDNDEPEYLKNLPPPSDDELWKRLENTFEDLHHDLRSLRLETKEQAVPQRVGDEMKDRGVYVDDREAGGRVKSELQISFNPVHENLGLVEKREVALELADSLKTQIRKRTASVMFAHNWGVFCEYAAQWQMAYLQEQSNLGYLKGAARNSRAQHARWYARLYEKFRTQARFRAEVDNLIIDHVLKLSKLEPKPKKYPSKEWCLEVVNEETMSLRHTIRDLPLHRLPEIAEEPDGKLPSLGLKYFPTSRR